MEAFYAVVGCIMIYSWIHSAFLMFPLISKMKGYNKFVSIMGVVWFALVVLGIFTDSYK